MKKNVQVSQNEINERKTIEEALLFSENRYHLIMNGARDAILIGHSQGKILDVNPAACELYGYCREVFLTKTVTDIVLPEFMIGPGNDTADPDNKIPRHPSEIVATRSDGSCFPAEMTARFQTFGKEILTVVVIRDISPQTQFQEDHRLLKETLQESESRSQALLEALPDQMFILDNHGNFLDFHASDPSNLFLPGPDFLGKNVLDIFPARTAEMFLEAIATAHASGKPQIFLYILRINGKSGFYEVRLVPYGTTKFLSIISDVTNRQKVEEALLRFSTALRMTTDSVLITDLKGRIVEINESALYMFGVKEKSDLLGQDIIEMVVPEERDDAVAEMQTVLQKGSVKNKEHHIKIKGDRIIPIEMSISLMSDPEKNFIGLVVITRDISIRKETEEQLRFISSNDVLTQLHNRFSYEEKIKQLETSDQFPISVIMMDADDLKWVNDNLGHSKGDDLLIRLADVLKRTFRQGDFIARIGGDEFIVLMPQTNKDHLDQAVERLREHIVQENNSIPEYKISISIGGCTAEDTTSLKDVLSSADDLMYQEKNRKKNRG